MPQTIHRLLPVRERQGLGLPSIGHSRPEPEEETMVDQVRRTGSPRSARISAAKMGEYVDATALRREGILRDQKFPPQVKTVRYERARRAICAALVGGGEPLERLGELALSVERLVPKSTFDAECIRDSA